MGETKEHPSKFGGGALRTALLRIPPPLVYVAVFLIGVCVEAVDREIAAMLIHSRLLDECDVLYMPSACPASRG